MHTYAAHGLTLASALPFPALRPAEGSADVVIGPADLPHPDAAIFEEGRFGTVRGDALEVAWHRYVAIRAQPGRLSYAIDDEALVETVWLQQILLGAGLGLVLHARGTLVLHASAVRVPGGAALLLGHKGFGKSTTSAAFVAEGHELLADDVVAVAAGADGRLAVHVGPPQLKLWPDAAEALGLDAPHEPLHSRLDKRVVYLPTPSDPSPVPILGAFLLSSGEALSAAPVAGKREVFAELFPHLYAPRLVGGACVTPRHFERFSAFVRDVPLYRLQRERGLDRLPAIVDEIARVASRASAAVGL